MASGTAFWISRLFGFHGRRERPSDLSAASEASGSRAVRDGVEPEYYDASIAAEHDYRPLAINPWLY